MPLNAEGCLVDQTPTSSQSIDISAHAPPLYGEHVLDQLYADMDQPGLMTPTPQSGMNTPFYNHSQTGSSDNIASLDEAVDPNGFITPAALSSRLQNLDSTFRRMHSTMGSGGSTPHPEASSPDGPYSTARVTVISRRTSEDEEEHQALSNRTSAPHTPEHIDYSDLGDLSKVPSYSTAVRAPIPSATSPAGLPNYEAAVSTPPSPGTVIMASATPPEVSCPVGSRRGRPGSHVTDVEETRRLHLLRRRDGGD
jgi:hypothetical protein